MKFLITLFVLIFLLLIGQLGYYNTNFYIKKHVWKFSNGYWVGDFLDLKNKSQLLKADTLFGNGGVGTIKFCYGKRLMIQSLKTGAYGYYVSKP
ncbi:MAG: hypothetical protein QM726_10785 [Chitinophagaceae bacterium]